MINHVIDAICEALNIEFGNDIRIYIRQMIQNPITPCFLVSDISIKQRQYCGKRNYCEYTFSLQYLPVTDDPVIEINAVLQKLFDCLAYIGDTENMLSGTDMKAEIVNETLHFTVNYNFFTAKSEKEASMEQLINETSVKG